MGEKKNNKKKRSGGKKKKDKRRLFRMLGQIDFFSGCCPFLAIFGDYFLAAPAEAAAAALTWGGFITGRPRARPGKRPEFWQ